MATLQFRRGTAFIDPQVGEPFLDTNINGLKIGIGGSDFITLLSSGSLDSSISGIDNRLDSIELTTSSLNTSVSNINSFTQSFNTAISLDTSNVTILGNLDVQGTTTTIDSTTITLGDNIIELNGTGASNGGILVNDVTNPNTLSGSLLWDGTNDYWKAGQLGSENEIITTANIVSNLPSGTISGSSQITITESQISDLSHTDITSLNSYTASNDTTNSNQNASLNNLNSYTASNDTTNTTQNQRLSALESFTGSIDDGYVTEAELAAATGALETADSLLQSRANNLESFTSSIDTTIKTKLDSDGVISGSSQVDVTQTTNYSSINQYTDSDFDTRFGTKSTTDLSEGTNQYYTDTKVKTKLNTEGVISGSSQVDVTQTTNYSSINQYTDSDTQTYIDSIGLISGSVSGQLPSGTVSGSSQIDHDQTTNYSADEHFTQGNITTVGTVTTGNVDGILPSGVVSGSSQVDVTQTTNYSSINQYTDSDFDTRFGTKSTTDLSEGTNKYYTDSKVKTKLDVEGVISGSSQVDVTQTTNYSSINQYTDSDTQNYIDSIGLVSGSVSGQLPSGTVSGSEQIDHDLTLNFSPAEHFTQGNITTVGTVTTGNVDAILPTGTISGSSQITITESQISDLSHTDISSLNSYTSSNDTTNATQNQRLTSIESFTGSIDNDFVTEAELASATGALETADSLLQSRANNLESFTSSIDTTIKTKLDSDGVISGSSQIDHDLTTNFVANEHIDHSSITIGSGNGLSGGGTIDTNRSITLDTGSSHFTDGVVQSLPTGTVSGSSQVDVTQTTNYSSINQYTDSDTQAYIDSIGLISGSVSGQLPSGVVSGSSQVDVTQTTNYSQVVNISDAQSITGTKTFEDIIVNGTGSFAYIEQVTGSAKIIGDAFIILNNNTPTERYAGISIYDSGSSNNTSSLIYDGSTDDWFFEKDVLGSAEYGVAMFGPEYSTKGTPTYLTNNTVPKGNGGHHLNDSNITDNGSTISLDSTLYVTQSRIGIGTTTPDAKLEIQTVSDNELLRFHRTNASAGDVDITFYHGTSDLASKITHHYVGGGKGELGFRTGEGSTLGLYQNQDGDVGINTTSPSTKLHVKGNILVEDNDSTDTVAQIGNSGDDGWINLYANGVSKAFVGANTTSYFNGGSVGIGTTSPDALLELKESSNGAGDAVIRLRGHGLNADNTVLGAIEWFNTDSSGDQPGVVARVEAQSGNANGHMGELVFKTHDGSEGGEGSSPKENMRLDVDGNLFVSGTIRAQGDVVAFSSSDKRFKDNLTKIVTPLTKITQISGYSFDWNTEKQHIYKGKDYGVVAQEIQEVLPELVQERENGYLAVNYEKLVPLLIESIKELKAQVDHLNKKLENK